MTVFDMVLMAAVLLCSLVAGFLLAFAIVVMPGLAKLDDRSFMKAFRSIDSVIQTNQTLFMLMWAGSVVALLFAAAWSIVRLPSVDRILTAIAACVYMLGVQFPTIRVNIPLNDRLQKLDPDTLSDCGVQRARLEFEGRWNRWNVFRTMCAILTSIMLLLVLIRA